MKLAIQAIAFAQFAIAVYFLLDGWAAWAVWGSGFLWSLGENLSRSKFVK